MDKNSKHAFIAFAFLTVFFWKGYAKKTLSDFYLYKIDQTKITQGVISNANFDDAISGMTWQCSYLYHVNNAKYGRFENISVYDTLTNFSPGDTLQVRYNVRRPFDATIDSDYNLRTRAFMGLILVVWIVAAFVFLVIEIRTFFSHRRRTKTGRR